jgi:hypothetical protein
LSRQQAPKPLPQIPTSQLIGQFCQKFDRDERNGTSDRAILRLVKLMPLNTDLEEILLKVCAINDLYSTRIFITTDMARHILSLNIDPFLEVGDPDIVDRIARARIGNKERLCFSFATKYCSWHNLLKYPIYDSFVQGMLIAYRDHYHFSRFAVDDLRIYPKFKTVIESFREHFGLSDHSLKEIDKFLWLYGIELGLRSNR